MNKGLSHATDSRLCSFRLFSLPIRFQVGGTDPPVVRLPYGTDAEQPTGRCSQTTGLTAFRAARLFHCASLVCRAGYKNAEVVQRESVVAVARSCIDWRFVLARRWM